MGTDALASRAHYCGPECQKEDWKEHKKECKQLAEEYTVVKAASAYAKVVAGQLEGPRRDFEKIVQVQRAQQGSGGQDEAGLAVSLLGLGATLGEEGRYEEGLEKLREGLGMLRRLLGDEHQHTAFAIKNMGIIHRQQGKLDEALGEMKEALRIQLRVLGHEHEDVAATLLSIATVHRMQGKLQEALEGLEESLKISRRLFVEESKEVASVQCSIAAVYRDQGLGERARGLFEACAKTFARVLGPEHSMTQKALRLAR